MLDDGGVDEAERGEDKADGDAQHWAELESCFAHDWVDDAVEDGDEDEDTDGIEVLHFVVWHAVAFHLSGLRDEVAAELAVADPENGVEDEDLAGSQSTDQLINEMVAPRHWLLVASSTDRRFVSIVASALDHDADGFEGVGDDGALWRADDVRLPSEDQDGDTDVEHAETEQEGCPEALELLHEWRCEKGQASQVDTPVEDL
jgi:hypothetical protein